MSDYPQMIVREGHVEPVPRRIRAFLGGQTVLDTTAARYVWESPKYPQYYVPLEDVDEDLLVDEGRARHRQHGNARRIGLRAGPHERPNAGWVYDSGELSGTVRLLWPAVDAWFEEDEQVYVHPRSPYTRVDALRSTRRVRVELDGTVLAESDATVMVFETGLPTRYYFDRPSVDYSHLLPTDTVTACPYKGVTSAYWSAQVGDEVHPDLAWAYDFPTRQLSPITGLVAFYNEQVDVSINGERLERPVTHFSRSEVAGQAPT
jgi:uncharacterized protein (DUF427 family)